MPWEDVYCLGLKKIVIVLRGGYFPFCQRKFGDRPPLSKGGKGSDPGINGHNWVIMGKDRIQIGSNKWPQFGKGENGSDPGMNSQNWVKVEKNRIQLMATIG